MEYVIYVCYCRDGESSILSFPVTVSTFYASISSSVIISAPESWSFSSSVTVSTSYASISSSLITSSYDSSSTSSKVMSSNYSLESPVISSVSS